MDGYTEAVAPDYDPWTLRPGDGVTALALLAAIFVAFCGAKFGK